MPKEGAMAALPNAVRGAGRFQWHCFAGKIGSEKAAMQSPAWLFVC